MKAKREFKKHPLAIAWDKWIASPEGKPASDPTTLGSTVSARNYLENRLQLAFMAGAEAERTRVDNKTK